MSAKAAAAARTTQCGHCGRDIHRPPSKIKRAGVSLCGRACANAWKRSLTGAQAGGWQGGVRVSNGRAAILMPEHPYADSGGYVYRYRLVMEQHLGRYLDPDEVVHHEDNNSLNDDVNNLMLFASKAEHARYHGRLRGGLNERRPAE